MITDVGLATSIEATNNEGFNLVPVSFSVSDVAGTLDPTRTTKNAGVFYSAAISSRVVIDQNTLKFILTIPPNQIPTGTFKLIKEIYLDINDSSSNPFLFAIGQPTDEIRYNADDQVTLELEMSITNLDLTANFVFEFTQATEITEHNTDPAAHPEWVEAMKKAGIFLPAGSVPFERRGQVFEDNNGLGVEFDGTKAVAPIRDGVIFTATFNGTELNTFDIVPDGNKDADTLRADFNALNFPNTVEHDGVGTEIISSGALILSGGTYNVSENDLVYKDVDSVYKKAIADGTIASKVVGVAYLSEKLIVTHGLVDINTGFAVSTTLFLSGTVAGSIGIFDTNVSVGLSLGDHVYFSGFPGDVSLSASQEFDAVVSNGSGVGLFTETQLAINSVSTNSSILIDKLELLKNELSTNGKKIKFVFNGLDKGWKKFAGQVASFRIDFDSVPDNGTWRIEWNGQESADLPFNASNGVIQTEFNLFSGHTGVTVTGDYSAGLVFTFADEIAQPLPTFVHAGLNEIQRFNFGNIPDNGTIQFEFEGQGTINHPWDDLASDLKIALENLSTINLVNVTGGFASNFYEIEFDGIPFNSDGLQPQGEITVIAGTLNLLGAPTLVNGIDPQVTVPISPLTIQQGRYKANNLRVGASDIVMTVTENTVGEPVGPDTAIVLDSPNVELRGLGLIEDFVNGVDVNNQNESVIEMRFNNVANPILSGDRIPGLTADFSDTLGFAKDIFSQLRLTEHPSNGKRLKISTADVNLPTGVELVQEIKSLLLSFSGAEIDFSTGQIFESDGTTPLGQNFTPVIPVAQQFRYASIAVIPELELADKTLKGQMLVLFAENDGISTVLAEKAPFGSAGINLGLVSLEGDLGLQEISRIITARDIFGSLDGKTIILQDDVGSVAFWFDIDDSGTTIPPLASAANRAIEITTVNTNDDPNLVASALQAFINADSKFSATISTNRIIITDATIGPRTDISSGDTGFFVDVQQQGRNTDATGLVDIKNSAIKQLGTGGSGGGSGDASTILIRMEDLLSASFYEWLEPNIFSIDEQSKVALTDASFSVVNKTYDFVASEFLDSLPLLDDQFLADLKDLLKVQVAMVFDSTSIDPAPLVELTPNGNLADRQAVTMEQLGADNDTFVGELIFDLSLLTIQTLNEYNVSNAGASIELDLTTQQQIGQEFTTNVDTNVEEQLEVYLIKTGAPLGFIKVNLHEDNAGDAGSVISQTLVDATSLSVGNNIITVQTGRHVLTPSTKYHVSISTDQAYKDSFTTLVDVVDVRVDSSAPTINDLKLFNGTIWSALVGSAVVHKVEGRKLDLLMKYTASATSKLKGYGVYYGENISTTQSIKRRDAFVFDGTIDNLNDFQLTFEADPSSVRVADVFTGQVWVVPAFELQNNKVVFEANFFNGRGNVALVIDQPEAGGFDNNPANLSLLAENNLGSNDVALDKSVSNRGIKLRNNIGLRELALDDDDNIIILST